MIRRSCLIIFTLLALLTIYSQPLYAEDWKTDHSQPTGLINSQASDDFIRYNGKRIKKVHINQLGNDRIKAQLKKQGRTLRRATVQQEIIADNNQDIESEIDPSTTSSGVSSLSLSASYSSQVGGTLPTFVDNSQNPWFPPIRSQGSLGSCAPFSITYYQLSYMQARDKDIAINTGDTNVVYSPKFVYNLINYGQNAGSSFSDNYQILENNGAPTWAELPYNSDYLSWPTNAQIWRNALNARINPVQYTRDINTPAGLEQLKQLLNNGYILIFGTYIYDWRFTTIKNNVLSSADDPFINQNIASYAINNSKGGHSMTIVGYNDDIWTDINGNGVVDTGELGALKIANSWGSGWGNSGFMWLAYDAIQTTSKVAGAPTAREGAIWGNWAYVMTVKSNYTPKLIGQFTLNQAQRNQNLIVLGTSNTTATTPTITNYSLGQPHYNGGAFSYNGSTTAIDGNFVVDFTDLLPSGSTLTRYYIQVFDNAAGNSTILKNFKLINTATGEEIVGNGTPREFDRISSSLAFINSWADYNYNTARYTVTTSAINGSILINPTQSSYGLGDTITLTAIPYKGYKFNSWSGDISSSSNPVTITIDGNKSVTANFTLIITNKAPVVNAGTDQTIQLPNTASLHGSATDDGLPSQTLTSTWSLIQGPSQVAFANAQALNTSVSFSTAGTYLLRLTVSDGELSSSDDIVVTVKAVSTFTLNTAATNGAVTRSPNQASYQAGDKVTLTAIPNKGYQFDSWSGDISSSSNPVTITIDGNKSVTANFTLIIINKAPVVNAGTDQTIQLPNTASLRGSATDDGLPSQTLTSTWSLIQGPSQVAFANAQALNTSVSFSTAGTYLLRLTVSDGELSSSDDIVVTVKAVSTFTLNTAATNGAVTRSPNQASYQAGDKVTLTAIPNKGYQFDSWSGDISSSSNPVTITIDGNKSVTANFTLIITNKAPVVNAGTDQTIQLPNTVNLSGGATDDGLPSQTLTSTWSMVEGPSSALFTDKHALTTSVSFYAAGTYMLRLTVSDGELSSSDDIVVTVKAVSTFTLNTAATNGAVTRSPNQASYQAGDKVTLTAIPNKGYQFDSWSGDISSSSNPVTITIDGNKSVTANFTLIITNKAPVVNAGTDQTIQLPNTVNLSGGATDDGLPNQTLTSQWSLVEGAGQVTFANAQALKTSAAFSTAGTYLLRLTVSDGELSSSDDIVVTVKAVSTFTLNTAATNGAVTRSPNQASYQAGDKVTLTAIPNKGYQFDSWSGDISSSSNPVTITIDGNKSVTANFTLIITNKAPVVNAGTDQTIQLPNTASLHGSATDDGLPNQTLTSTWSMVEGPSSALFTDKHALTTSVSFYAAGTYMLRLTVSDGELSSSDDIVVTVKAVSTFTLNTAATNGAVTRSPNQASYQAGDKVTLTAIPNKGYQFDSWSGDISSSSNPVTITIDGNKSVTANFTLIITNKAPVVNAGTDQTIQLPNTASLRGSATDDGLPSQTLTSTWSMVEGPSSALFTDKHALTTSVSFYATGTYMLRLTVSDGELSSSDDIIVTVKAVPAYTLNTTATNGAVTRSPNQASYQAGDKVTLTAIPNKGYQFDSWSGDISSSSNPVTITIDGNKSVTANFKPITNNKAPVVDAGLHQRVQLNSSVTLQGKATDDGNPNNSLTISWSQIYGRSQAILDNPNSLTTSVKFPQKGFYIFRLTASDGELTSSDYVIINVIDDSNNTNFYTTPNIRK
ncbi:MAG: C1 family peptidase [Candidatus Omnitrophica bacterium]|nr:C1 family peptidase [Candidatus Omnitrophota bacterium]